MVPDGTFQLITHVGSTTLTTTTGSIPLSDILVCTSMKQSLLSVSKLCDDYSCRVYFDANVVYIIDLQTQKVVTEGHEIRGYIRIEESGVCSFLFKSTSCCE